MNEALSLLTRQRLSPVNASFKAKTFDSGWSFEQTPAFAYLNANPPRFLLLEKLCSHFPRRHRDRSRPGPSFSRYRHCTRPPKGKDCRAWRLRVPPPVFSVFSILPCLRFQNRWLAKHSPRPLSRDRDVPQTPPIWTLLKLFPHYLIISPPDKLTEGAAEDYFLRPPYFLGC